MVPGTLAWCCRLVLCLAAATYGLPVRAQPAVNPGALDALQSAPRPRPAPARPEGARQDAGRPATPRPAPSRPDNARTGAAKPAPKPAAPAPAAIPAPPRPPAVPVAPPAIAAIPPAVAVPVQRPPDPPPIPVTADAPGTALAVPGTALAVPGGVRATFGTDRSDLNPGTEAAIRGFARPLRDTAQSVNVLAYAAGSADDPSTPRRLSLARALAARAVLINEGIASTRIYVRALGPAGGDGPPDRVDVSTGTPGAPTPAAPASGPAP